MSELPSNYTLVPANTLNGDITITRPISDSQVNDLMQTWVARQDKFWPSELTVDVLTHNLQCVYIAQWILHAKASATWSASIGTDREKYVVCGSCKGTRGTYQKDIYGDPYFSDCGTCGGKGQVRRTYTVWNGQSGVADALLNGVVVENIANNVRVRCGKRDLKANESPLSSPFQSDILVLQPENIGTAAGTHIAENLVHSEVKQDAQSKASGRGQVRDLQTAYISVEDIKVRTWLYPIFVGSYHFEEELHLVEIDGITGEIHVDVPKSVQNERIFNVLKIIAIIVAVLAVIGGIVWLISDVLN